MATTKAPSGLTIKRKNWQFTFAWKKGETYTAQVLEYRVKKQKWGAWQSLSVGSGTTSKVITLSASNYYPNSGKGKLKAIEFRVKGKANNKNWSGYTSKTKTILLPRKPGTVSFTLDGEEDNKGTFSYKIDTNETSDRFFIKSQYQSVLVKDTKETNGANVSWKNATAITGAGAENSVTIKETVSVVGNDSYTRFFRVRSVGPRDATGWKYGRHVYAAPQPGDVTEASSKEYGGGRMAFMKWNQPAPVSHPVDSLKIEHAIETPLAGLNPPTSGWEEAMTVAYKQAEDSASFVTPNIDLDQCLFVRIIANHDSHKVPSSIMLATAGTLTTPSMDTPSMEGGVITVSGDHNSDVPDSFIVVMLKTQTDPEEITNIGIIPHTENSIEIDVASFIGTDGYSVGIKEVQGSYIETDLNGATVYSVIENMVSESVWHEAAGMPRIPTGLTATPTSASDIARVTWNDTWAESTGATLSWAESPLAWESTQEPSTYSIPEKRTSWNISGLEPGKLYYIRVRLDQTQGDSIVSSAWSDPITIVLSAAPTTPVLTLDQVAIAPDGAVTASWAYVSGDGSPQAAGEVVEAIITNGVATPVTQDGRPVILSQTTNAQSLRLTVEDINRVYEEREMESAKWSAGETHYLMARVISESGQQSEAWSAPTGVTIVEKPTATITATSLVDSQNEELSEEYKVLTAMPLTATVTGAGTGGTTSIIIERAADYFLDRPDEEKDGGNEGESIAVLTHTGEEPFTVSREELLGRLDDGAEYTLIATVTDEYGQTAEARQKFIVAWTHQAERPTATVETETGETYRIAKITPTAPDTAEEGDTVDIYRLSTDKPELIITGAQYGTTYVDPYPASMGGYRVVDVTYNGDYIEADNTPAWIDIESGLKIDELIIDYDGHEAVLPYNITLSNSWAKDFERTTYLGGSIVGDWNKGVTHDLTVQTVAIVAEDDETIETMRRLSNYAGICHVRTPDGSSFAADVTVGESQTYESDTASFDIKIEAVEPQGSDGMTLAEWQALGEV